MAARFWVAGTGDWSDAGTHWATETGGSAGTANLPTSSDDVTIDANSGFGGGGTITLDVEAEMHDFISNSGHTYTILYSVGDIYVYGSTTFESGLTEDGAYLYFLSTSSETINPNGASFPNDVQINFEGIGGSWTLQDDLEITGEFYQKNGTFDANDHNVTANDFYFYAYTGYTPTVIMGSGTWEATGTGNVWDIDETAEVVTITPETSTIKFTDATATTKNFIGSDKTYYNIWFSGSGTGNFVIIGSNTFNDFKVDTPPHTVKFTEGETTTFSSFTVSGTAGNLITIDSVDGATQHILSKSSGIVSCDYLDISNSNATGGATWYAGSHSVDTTNNDGWIFSAPLATLNPRKFW